DVAFLDQIEEAETAVQIPSSNRYHQAQVALDQVSSRMFAVLDEPFEPLAVQLVEHLCGGQLAGRISAGFHALGQADLVRLREQIVIGNFAQVHCARATTELLIDAERRPPGWLGYLGC